MLNIKPDVLRFVCAFSLFTAFGACSDNSEQPPLDTTDISDTDTTETDTTDDTSDDTTDDTSDDTTDDTSDDTTETDTTDISDTDTTETDTIQCDTSCALDTYRCHDSMLSHCEQGTDNCPHFVTVENCVTPDSVCDELTGQCVAPTCTDGSLNGAETDTDCGGTDCQPCDTGQICQIDDDCSYACIDNLCVAPTCTDGSLNGTETDTDCGGMDCQPCDVGQICQIDDDCSYACIDNLCVEECPVGKYGRTCESTCPTYTETFCGDGTCHDGRLGDGSCNCPDGYAGDICEKCEIGRAGQDCQPCEEPGFYCPGFHQSPFPCPYGDWDDDADPSTACIEHSTCPPGTVATTPGTRTTDTECSPSFCGDEITDPAIGEECDDGDTKPHDRCDNCQENTATIDVENPSASGHGFSSVDWHYQTFVATRSGYLHQINLLMRDYSQGCGYDSDFQLFEGAGGMGALLADRPSESGALFCMVGLDFADEQIFITAGETYTLAYRKESIENQGIIAVTSNTDRYTAGCLTSDISGVCTPGNITDLVFTTFVYTP